MAKLQVNYDSETKELKWGFDGLSLNEVAAIFGLCLREHFMSTDYIKGLDDKRRKIVARNIAKEHSKIIEEAFVDGGKWVDE